MVNFGHRIKQLRLERGMTQQQLADRLCVTKSVVSYYENGSRNPTAPIICSMAQIFHVSTDFLLGMENSNTLTIDCTGLSEQELSVITALIDLFHQNKDADA